MPTRNPEARAVEFARGLDMMAAAAPDDHALEYTLRQIGELLGGAYSIAAALAAHLDDAEDREACKLEWPQGHWSEWSALDNTLADALDDALRAVRQRAAEDWLQRAVRLIAPHREQVAA
jgi:hypothetical protein